MLASDHESNSSGSGWVARVLFQVGAVGGVVAFASALAGAAWFRVSLLNRDDPYIVAWWSVLTVVPAMVIYFVAATFARRFVSRFIAVALYTSLLLVGFGYVELQGGEASGWGYMFMQIHAFGIIVALCVVQFTTRTLVAAVFWGLGVLTLIAYFAANSR